MITHVSGSYDVVAKVAPEAACASAHSMAHNEVGIEPKRRVYHQLALRCCEHRRQPAALARVGAEENCVMRANQLEQLRPVNDVKETDKICLTYSRSAMYNY